MTLIVLADVACFVSVAMLAWTLRGKFGERPCEIVFVPFDQPCPCQDRKRDERGRFTR